MWNLAHRNGMLATAQAACWLVLAGFALRQQKKAIGHGGWLKWIDANCEYGKSTAENYMGLAEGIETRAKTKKAALGDMRAEDFRALLDKSAGTLDESEQLRLLKAVHGLTGEATIRQLYLDFGIIKKRPQLGGDSRIPCPKCRKLVKSGIEFCPHCQEKIGDPGQTPTETAIDLWAPIIRGLHREFAENSWADLPDKGEISRVSLQGILIDLSAALRKATAAK